jgi:hypothetical protein
MMDRKDAGSSPYWVDFFFSIDVILPAANMALGSTQPLTEMSTRKLSGGGKGLLERIADNLTAICEPTV